MEPATETVNGTGKKPMFKPAKPKAWIKGAIFGPYGIGKTTLLLTLPPERTLFVDFEAGDLAVKGFPEENIVRPRSWPEARALAAVIGGVDPAADQNDIKPYGMRYHEAAKQSFPIDLDKYDNIFFDSITVASRLALKWVKQQPDAHDKQGNFSNLKAYGMLGQEMMSWFIHLQHTQNKNIWFVGLLEKETDDLGTAHWVPQMEGSKAGKELPGIVDQVITMQEITIQKEEKKTKHRAFICQGLNKWNYPAKDRSGCLSMIEPPHLGRLIEKIHTSTRSTMSLNFDIGEVLDDAILF